MLASNGEITAPCGVPTVVSLHCPSSLTPAFNHFWISRSRRGSPIRHRLPQEIFPEFSRTCPDPPSPPAVNPRYAPHRRVNLCAGSLKPTRSPNYTGSRHKNRKIKKITMNLSTMGGARASGNENANTWRRLQRALWLRIWRIRPETRAEIIFRTITCANRPLPAPPRPLTLTPGDVLHSLPPADAGRVKLKKCRKVLTTMGGARAPGNENANTWRRLQRAMWLRIWRIRPETRGRNHFQNSPTFGHPPFGPRPPVPQY